MLLALEQALVITFMHYANNPFQVHWLVGMLVGIELNKWMDERIANCESPDMDYRRGEVLKLLLSLLKIGCQHYGKLGSPFGTNTVLRENDTPEFAIAKLFAFAKRNNTQYGALSHCLQNLPSEGQIQATASKVQNLLVSGWKKEALLCAQEGQFVASQLGDQFYVDTVKQMALCQLVPGSPLLTLCLLIARQPTDVFSADMSANSGLSGAINMSQQPVHVLMPEVPSFVLIGLMHFFLEFQLPRHWTSVFCELPLGPQWKQPSTASLSSVSWVPSFL